MGASYNGSVVAEIIDTAVKAKGRGAKSELARATGVTPTTTGEWCSGKRTPGRHRWSAIETFLDLEPGTIAAAAASEDEAVLLEVRQELLNLREQLRASGDTRSAKSVMAIEKRLDSIKLGLD